MTRRIDGGEGYQVMKLFTQIVKTAVNVATLPVAIAKDVITLGGVASGRYEPYTVTKLKEIKKDSE